MGLRQKRRPSLMDRRPKPRARGGRPPSPGPHVLLSIHHDQAELILSKRKRWEFRRRRPAFPPGTVIWLYATKPIGAVVGLFRSGRVLQVDVERPQAALARAGSATPDGLRSYFAGLSKGHAIEVLRPRRLSRPISLHSGGAGPMSYRYLTPADARLLSQLSQSVAAAPNIGQATARNEAAAARRTRYG